jgi:multiple sugar transport system substrate-binding protein
MKRYSRRDFIKTSLATGAGLATAGMTGFIPRAHGAVTLDFKGWDYSPDLVRENINKFENQYPDIKVKYEAVGGNYMDKMAALFVAKSPLDCLYVRDTNFAGWVEAGWLRDIEGLPRVDEYKKRIYPGNLDAMKYDGKLYGLPYYTDHMVMIYRKDIIEKAGFSKPPKTLDELHEQCMKIKEKGLMEHPFSFGLKFAPGGNFEWWTINYACGIDYFDKDKNPIMQDDPRAEKVLQWFMDAINKYKYLGEVALEMEHDKVRDAVSAGAACFGVITKYDVQRCNDPKFSKFPGLINLAAPPSLDGTTSGTANWSRMYCLTSHVKKDRIDAAWKLIQYLGGEDKNGELYTAKRWYLLKGLGFAYPELWDDSSIAESTAAWGDLDVIKAIGQTSRPIEVVKEPWYYDWQPHLYPTLQKAMTKKITAKQCLTEIADLAKKYKKEW